MEPWERTAFTFTSKAVPDDTFSVVRFSGTEAMSKPYRFDITLSSHDPEIDLKAVLQNPATLTIRHAGEALPFHGVLAGFEQLHEVKQHAFYRAILVPKLWNASLYHQSQVFLDKTVPQIVEEVLKQAGLSGQDYQLSLTRSYPTWEYVCQFQETDLDFVSRWMEREGIYYFFEQSEQGAKMVVSDNRSIHKEIPGDPDVPYSPPSGLIASNTDIVRQWVCRQKTLPAKVILKDHNYRTPGLEMKAEAAVDANGRGEVYLYGEHFKDSGQGNDLARIRAEELLCREREFHGEATAPAFSPGYVFELGGHYRSDYNRRYLIVEVAHEGSQSETLLAGLAVRPSGQEETAGYSNRFVCIPADAQFRPERRTEKPRFHGTMNAVVDAAGDGKYAEVDDQGRYKVMLPLDLSGRKDGKASRFVRMAQPYSGFTASDGVQGPSGMHFPLHKGAEVLLTFVDGDPDRPVISGAVPNPQTVSPVVQGNQTQSVIRDNYGNEFILDSTPGDEHIRLYSPHHNSGLELGRSMLNWSASDASQFSAGNNWGVTIGNKLDFTFGSYTEVKAGFSNSVTVGYKVDLNCGVTHAVDYALDLKSNYEPVVQCSKKDILTAAGQDQVLTAGDQVCIISGDRGYGTPLEDAADKAAASAAGSGRMLKKMRERQAQTARGEAGAESKPSEAIRTNRSIINVFPEKMILSVGPKADTFKIDNTTRTPGNDRKAGEIFTKTPPEKELTKYSVYAAVIAASSGMISEIPQDEISRGITGGVFGGLTGILGLWLNVKIRDWAKKYTNDDAIEPVGHRDPAARIEMDHEGNVRVNSKSNSVVVRVGENGAKKTGAGLRLEKDWVLLGKTEDLEEKTSNRGSQLKMEKKGNVFLVAEETCVIKAKKVYMGDSVVYGPAGNLKILK